MYRVYRNQGQGSITHGVKSLDMFYLAMLSCPIEMLSGKYDKKYFNIMGISPLIALQRGYSQIL